MLGNPRTLWLKSVEEPGYKPTLLNTDPRIRALICGRKQSARTPIKSIKKLRTMPAPTGWIHKLRAFSLFGDSSN